MKSRRSRRTATIELDVVSHISAACLPVAGATALVCRALGGRRVCGRARLGGAGGGGRARRRPRCRGEAARRRVGRRRRGEPGSEPFARRMAVVAITFVAIVVIVVGRRHRAAGFSCGGMLFILLFAGCGLSRLRASLALIAGFLEASCQFHFRSSYIPRSLSLSFRLSFALSLFPSRSFSLFLSLSLSDALRRRHQRSSSSTKSVFVAALVISMVCLHRRGGVEAQPRPPADAGKAWKCAAT